MKSSIYLAYHLDAPTPKSELYRPIHVGAERSTVSLQMLKDNTHLGHLSGCNNLYSELTALDSICVNDSDSDIIGFGHYRRTFLFSGLSDLMQKFPDLVVEYEYGKQTRPMIPYSEDVYDYVFDDQHFEKIKHKLDYEYDMIVGKPFTKSTTFGLFTFADLGWIKAKAVILFYEFIKQHKETPNTLYHEIVNSMLSDRNQYCNNMLIAKKPIFVEYSGWLMSLLTEFHTYLLNSGQDNLISPRMFGYFSEYLLKPYILYKSYNVFESDIICFNNLKTDNRI
jgi:hypothetical protein